VAALVFLAALGLRLLHLREIQAHDPFFAQASVDGAFYHAWALEILSGDWLGDGVLYLGPLYPMFMAGVYALLGPSLPALKAVQAVLGAVSCVLVWGLARELFDRRVAALAGGLAVFYAMLVFYGGTVMIVNLQVPLVLGLVWALLRALRQPSFGRWVGCGLLLGLSALARQTTLLLAPVMALWLVFGMAGPATLGRRFALAASFGAAILALVLPFTAKNYVAGDDLVLLNSTGGANFYMGNQPGADGTWRPPPISASYRLDNPRAMRDAFTGVAESEAGRPLKASEVSSFWLALGLEEVRADPERWMWLEVRKFFLFFNAYEVWNNRSVEVSERFSWVLRLPLVAFGLVAPLGLLGLVLSLQRWRELFPVYATLGVYLAGALVFFVLSRYRMPAAMLFLPFAAFAVFELADRLRERDLKTAGERLAVLVFLAVLVHLPIPNKQRMHMAYYNLGNKYAALERWDEAFAAYHASLAEKETAIATHNNLALAYERANRLDDAIESWQRVYALASARSDGMRLRRAAEHLRDLGVDPDAPRVPGEARSVDR